MKKSLDFKLNYYYYKYKDTPLPSSEEFRKNFKKREYDFPYLNELIIMIINYQVKKYGMTLQDPNKILRREIEKDGKYTKSKKTWYL